MVLFCALWQPVFFLFWREFNAKNSTPCASLSLVLGILLAGLRYAMPRFWEMKNFGLSAWIGIFVDHAAFPLIFPLAILCLLKCKGGFIEKEIDGTGFILCALIPQSIVYTIFWSNLDDPLRLVITPLLQTASSILLDKLLSFFKDRSISAKAALILSIGAVFSFASTVWWLFFNSYTILAIICLCSLILSSLVIMVRRFTQLITLFVAVKFIV